MRPELDRLDALDQHVSQTGSLAGSILQGLDLTGRSTLLRRIPVAGAVFVGCTIDAATLEILVAGGAAIQPDIKGLAFRPYRTRLYDGAELFDRYVAGDASTLASALDSRVYRWSRGELTFVDAIAKRLHDASIDDALAEFLADASGRGVVAIMGGHSLGRSDDRFRAVAELARALARAGFLVASGGGPGAMEATNLGAWLATHPDDHLEVALEELSAAPFYDPIPGWLDAACRVLELLDHSDNGVSLGVPTWHYGHEPPNIFASHIAKYFDNSIREDGLLAIATAGIVFTPGSAGTIQEIFQDAAQNHYKSFGGASPMVFMDTEYWTQTKPVYPLLSELADGNEYGDLLGIYDTVDEIVTHLTTN